MTRAAAPQDTVKGAVDLERRQQIRVSVRTRGTVKLLDLRIWIEEGGAWIPTGRGFALEPKEWTQLKRVLETLHREKDGRGAVDATPRP
jgi:hypothetical protein